MLSTFALSFAETSHFQAMAELGHGLDFQCPFTPSVPMAALSGS